MPYDGIYLYMCKFANYKINGLLLCRLLAPVALIILLWISRIVSSVIIKIFAVVIALMLYFFPTIINMFAY